MTSPAQNATTPNTPVTWRARCRVAGIDPAEVEMVSGRYRRTGISWPSAVAA